MKRTVAIMRMLRRQGEASLWSRRLDGRRIVNLRMQHVFALALALTGCTSNVEEFGDVVAVEKAAVEKVPFEAMGEISSYAGAKQSERVAWAACRAKTSKGLVLLVNRDGAGFNSKGVCEGWLSQAFLAEGFDVLTVNRPGFGDSTGDNDLGGPQSVLALQAALQAYQTAHPSPKLTGVWGMGSGAIAAGQLAKRASGLSWVMMGNGLYDAEQAMRQTRDAALKQGLEGVVGTEREAGLEKRSLAWDFEGLPKTVLLYHAELDEAVPASQASAFRDSLAAQEYRVRLMVLEKVGHDLPPDLHYGVLRKILAELNAREK